MAVLDNRNHEKERQCLKCLNSFPSQHAGNRICKKCTAINADERATKRVPLFNIPEDGASLVDDEDL